MCDAFTSYFFFTDTATTDFYTLSLHDALPISHGTFRSIRTYVNSKLFRINTYKKTGGRALSEQEKTAQVHVVNSRAIRYIAAIPASNTPLSSETEIRCSRLNSASIGLSAAVS